MTCPLHTVPQSWCNACASNVDYTVVVGNPLLRETVVSPPPAPCPDCDYATCRCRNLHDTFSHPLFEYETTTTGRKSNQGSKPCGEGWEPNMRIDNSEYREGVLVKEYRRNWDRFEFTEEEYWMRRKPAREVMGDRPRTVMLRESPVTANSHDAQAARIAGLEANVNEKLATIAERDATIVELRDALLATKEFTVAQCRKDDDWLASRRADEREMTAATARIAALESQLREAEVRRRNACATITDITDALGITGPHQGIDDSEALAAVREYVAEQRATVIALHDEIATLRAVESVAITSARIAALAAALRKALADVDPKAMSTYEQQQARREARALLEEVA